MGKSTNGLGVFRGKVGSVVFQVNKGDMTASQIVRAYQPIVTNPRTDAQMIPRAKMTLAGQISSVVDTEVLSAFRAGNNRKNRGKFTSNIIRASEVTKSNGQFTASVPASAIKFSDGGFANPFTVTPRIGQGSSILNVDIESSLAAVGEYGLRVVALLVHTADGADRYDAAVFTDVIPQSAQSSTTLDLTRVISETGANNVYVYAVPFKLTDRSNVSTDFIVSEGEVISSGLNRSISVSGYDFGRTQYAGVAPIVDVHALSFSGEPSGQPDDPESYPTGIEIDGSLIPLTVNGTPSSFMLTAGRHTIKVGGGSAILTSNPLGMFIGSAAVETPLPYNQPVEFTMPSADMTITFVNLQYTTTVATGTITGNTITTGSGLGTATATPSTVTAGERQALAATPASGYVFVGWYTYRGNVAQRITTEANHNYTPEATETLYAVFHNPEGD